MTFLSVSYIDLNEPAGEFNLLLLFYSNIYHKSVSNTAKQMSKTAPTHLITPNHLGTAAHSKYLNSHEMQGRKEHLLSPKEFCGLKKSIQSEIDKREKNLKPRNELLTKDLKEEPLKLLKGMKNNQ